LLIALFGSLVSFAALAIEPFVVRDIRVEGVQRTEAGTVFSYLPIRVGERMDDDKAAKSIKALYATGFYTAVRLEVENDVLVVFVVERPAIAAIEITGAKEFSKDNLKDGLKTAGISEAKIFDRSLLDRAEKEIKRQYTSRGFYSSKVTTTVNPQERNRVSLTFTIDEGDPSKIVDINIIGAKAVSESTLLKEFEQTTSGWFTFFTKDDQYSKQKLGGDLEKLRSYYLNRGYLDFNIESLWIRSKRSTTGWEMTVTLLPASIRCRSVIRRLKLLRLPCLLIRVGAFMCAASTFRVTVAPAMPLCVASCDN